MPGDLAVQTPDILAQYQQWVDWFGRYPVLLTICLFALTFAETLAVLGIFLPGMALIGVVSLIAGGGALPLWQALLAAWLGGTLATWTSYLLGRHYHARIRDLRPFRARPLILARSERWFYDYGMVSVFVGRFVGPLRAVISMVAGMADMSWRRFLVADLLSGILWSPFVILPFFIVGAAAASRIDRIQTPPYALPALIALFVCLWGMYRLLIFLWAHLHDRPPHVRRSLVATAVFGQVFCLWLAFYLFLDERWWAFLGGIWKLLIAEMA